VSDTTTLDDLLARKAALRGLPGWRVRAELLALERSLRVFTGNADELMTFLGNHQEPPAVLQLWAVNNREGFDRFLDEIDRMLHNFVAAAMSLKDHSTRVRRKLLAGHPADTLAAEHEQRIIETFGTAPLSQFVKQLRNYTTHRKLPIVTGHLSAVAGESFESRIVLHPSDLLGWRKWGSAARRYLEDAGDEIVVDDLVATYSEVVGSFHNWFYGALVKRHKGVIEALERAESELAQQWLTAFGPPPDQLGV
jgi:hypothetical protein